jgi:hypothetical protein
MENHCNDIERSLLRKIQGFLLSMKETELSFAPRGR